MKKLSIIFGLLLSPVTWGQFIETHVIEFAPAIPASPREQGICLNSSVVLPRFGAWQCAVGKKIFDPCFSSPTVNNAVVCDVNPGNDHPGFRVELAQPLPYNQGLPALPDDAWVVELADGLVCSSATGPAKIIQGVGTIAFICNEPGLTPGVYSGLLQEWDRGAPTWYAHQVHFTVQNGVYQQQDEQQVSLKTVWR